VIAVPVHLPVQRGVEVQIALAQEDPLLGVDPGGVAVGLLLFHGPHPRVEEGVEVGHLTPALRGRFRGAQGALADVAEAGGVVPVAVHDYRVVVGELPEDTQSVRLAPLDGRVEVHAVAFVVLRLLEGRVLGRLAPVLGEVGIESRVRVGAVDPAQGRQVLGEDVARLAVGVELDEIEHVAGAGAESDDAGGVAASVADVLDVLVLGLPVERGILRARHQFHGDLLLRRIVEPDRPGCRRSGRHTRGVEQRDCRQGCAEQGEERTTRGSAGLCGVVGPLHHGDSK
jgi:hypothetical protein